MVSLFMTDKDYDTLKARIEERFEFWIPRMGLTMWDVTRAYRRDGGDAEHEQADGYGTPMKISAAWEYLNAHITIYMHCIWAALDGEIVVQQIDRWIVHELWHCHFAELRTLVMESDLDHHLEHEERVTSTATAILAGLYEELERWDAKQEKRMKRQQQLIARLEKAVSQT